MTRKRNRKKVIKSKKPSLGSMQPTASTSTTDLMPSIPADDVTASLQVTADLSSVSVQVRP